MRRRGFVTLLGGVAAAWPLVAHAQQPERMRRIGILMPYAASDTEIQAHLRAFRQELQKLGWTEGGNIQFDERWTGDDMDLIRGNAASLLELKPDVLFAQGGRVIPVLMMKTSSVPIVFPGGGDPVGTGWVKSLARPGGNITGFSSFEFSVIRKMLEILLQIAPGTSRVAFIYNPDNRNAAFYGRSFESFATPQAVTPVMAPIHGIAELEGVLENFAKAPNGRFLRIRCYDHGTSRPVRRTRRSAPSPRNLFGPCLGQERWSDLLFSGSCRLVPARRLLSRSYSSRRKAGRSPRSAADEIPAHAQPQDREGARPPNSRQAARACRRGDRMKRREFITLVGGAAAAWPLAARAQQPAMPAIGFLNNQLR
jgi:hypothetical protein